MKKTSMQKVGKPDQAYPDMGASAVNSNIFGLSSKTNDS
jgi:hypothetical protein